MVGRFGKSQSADPCVAWHFLRRPAFTRPIRSTSFSNSGFPGSGSSGAKKACSRRSACMKSAARDRSTWTGTIRRARAAGRSRSTGGSAASGMAIHGNPRQTLVIGLGGGATAGAVSRFPFAEVDVIELSAAVVKAAPFFSSINYNLLERPNVHVRVDDGRNFLMLGRRKMPTSSPRTSSSRFTPAPAT